MQTLGYYQFMLIIKTGQENPVSYPIASAYGVILTLIVAPPNVWGSLFAQPLWAEGGLVYEPSKS